MLTVTKISSPSNLHGVLPHSGKALAATVAAAGTNVSGVSAAAARTAFVSGFHLILAVGGALVLSGAVVGFALIRDRDLHHAAAAPAPVPAGETRRA